MRAFFIALIFLAVFYLPVLAIEESAVDHLLALGVEEIIFSERGPGLDYRGNGVATPGHYYANFGYACVDPDFWFHCKDGSRLIKLNIKTGEHTIVLEDAKGAIRDPQVHYDGQKILFSYRKNGGHHYNLYEIGVDGTNLKQITSGPWDDIEPCYLPDGGIVFSSSRCKRYIACWMAPTAILYRCDIDGSNIRILSSNTVAENTPCVLSDGRVLYTRWEYVNRDPVVYHHLWTINADGSNQQIYFGNMHPRGVFIDAKPIYGTDRVVFIYSPSHGRPEHGGSIVTVTDNLGPDERSAIETILRGRDFRDPYPISKEVFLAAQGNKILCVEKDGKVSTLFDSSMMLHEPSPVRTRNRERVAPSRIDLTKDTATLILSDVYNGRNMSGIKRGAIKKLLIMEDLPKPVNFHGGGSQPIGHGVTTTLKRILGTVPVEADGSASFEVPPLRSIYFAVLDENDLSIKQMRSFVTLQPGETLSCVGCHEERTKAPLDRGQSKLLALSRAPSKIQPYKDVPEVMDFPRDVQPILDKHCIKCHNHKKRKGGLVLEGDRGPVYSQGFYSLILHWQVKDTTDNPVNRSGLQYGNDKPYACFSSASPLMKKIDGSHHGVKLNEHETRIIRLWLDTCTQYAGTYAAYGTGQVGGCWGNNKPMRVMDTDWSSTAPAEDAIKRRCGLCHGRELPKHITDTTGPLDHGDMLSWKRPMSRFSRHRIFNLTAPDKSLVLLSPLSKKSGGYAEGEPVKTQVMESLNIPPEPVKHPVIFENTDDVDYQKILTHVMAGRDKLNEIKRFDMPDFKPNHHYIREMKRYGVLPASFDLDKDSIDVYETDRKYWEMLWDFKSE